MYRVEATEVEKCDNGFIDKKHGNSMCVIVTDEEYRQIFSIIFDRDYKCEAEDRSEERK